MCGGGGGGGFFKMRVKPPLPLPRINIRYEPRHEISNNVVCATSE